MDVPRGRARRTEVSRANDEGAPHCGAPVHWKPWLRRDRVGCGGSLQERDEGDTGDTEDHGEELLTRDPFTENDRGDRKHEDGAGLVQD